MFSILILLLGQKISQRPNFALLRWTRVLPALWHREINSSLFSKTDVMIPMRDGVRLHTEIYIPKDITQKLPLILTRTPYGTSPDIQGYSNLLNFYLEMFADGYIFVVQDIRGRYGSEGQFIMLRPPRDRSKSDSIDEGTDAYDTIAWLVKNVPNNNGRVGIVGSSYGGWLATMALLEPHPALRAASEQSAPADMFLGDYFYHNGAFRLSYGFAFPPLVEATKTNSPPFKFDSYDAYDWFLALGPLSRINELYFHGTIPTWNNFVAHPNYDEFWQTQAFPRYLKDLTLTVPTLNVAGWWDQDNFNGPVNIYELLQPHDVYHNDYVVVGPWNHGGWAYGPGNKLGKVDFGANTSQYFRETIQAPWFAYWLKDKGNLPGHEVITFETGANKWNQWNAWPPHEGLTPQKLYFQANGRLSFDPLTETGEDSDSYISDPSSPVPYRDRPIEGTASADSEWLVDDQSFIEKRPDVLTWKTAPLRQDLTITGDIVAHLFTSTSGTDSDWIVKLIDVYPPKKMWQLHHDMSGFELMIADEVFRARFRNSFEHPEPLVPNQVTPITIDLHTNDHLFRKGHRIMAQVQSTWFPLIDRNPQKYVPNIFEARASDYVKATQRIYRSKSYPSNIEIPIIKQ